MDITSMQQQDFSLSIQDLKDLDPKTAVIVGGSIAFGMLLSSFVFQQVTAHEEKVLDEMGYDVIIDPDFLEQDEDGNITLKKRPQKIKHSKKHRDAEK